MWFLEPCIFWKLFSLILLNASCTCEVLSSVQFSHSVMSDSLQPNGLQYARLPCPYQFLELAQTHVHRVGDVVQPSVIPSSFCLQSFSASGSFPVSQFFTSGCQNIEVSASASSPSNEYSGLISFRMNWLDLLAVQGTLKGLLHTTVQNINSSAFSLLYGPTLPSINDYWKNHSIDHMDKVMSLAK